MAGIVKGIFLGGKPWANGGSSPGGTGGGGGTGGTVTATGAEFVADRIFQRDVAATSKAVPLAGTCSAGAALDVQIFNAATNAVVVDWTAATVTGTAFSKLLTVPQGRAWYRWRVRDRASGAVLWTSANQFAVGILVMMAGQSNMVKMWAEVLNNIPNSSRYVRRMAGGGWKRVSYYNDNLAEGTGLRGGTFTTPDGNGDWSQVWDGANRYCDTIATVTNTWSADLNVAIGLIYWGFGGTESATFAPPSGADWTAYINTNAFPVGSYTGYGIGHPSYTPDFEFAFWLQGEDDAKLNRGKAAYKANLAAIWAGLKGVAARGSALKFGVFSLGQLGSYYAATAGTVGPIRQAQLEFAAEQSANGVFLAGCCHDFSYGTSEVHFDENYRTRNGLRMLQGIKWQLGLATRGAAGPKVASASCAVGSSSVVLTIAHDGGTQLQDGTGATNSSTIVGFRVFRNGSATPETLTGTAITGASQVTVTLASARVAGDTLTVDHAGANAPYSVDYDGGSNAPRLLHVLYDNNTVPHDALGLPLQPTIGLLTVA